LKIFITGASGYIGGSVVAALMAAGHQVSGLARSDKTTAALAELGITPVRGTLDATEVLAKAAHDADVTINAADANHRAAAATMLKALAGTGKIFLHTDGSSIVGTRSRDELVEKVFDEDTPFTPTPQRASRVEIDKMVRSAASDGVRSVVIAPSLIYGLGHGLNAQSIQVPWLIKLAKKAGIPKHIGPGEKSLGQRAYRRRDWTVRAGDRESTCRRVLLRRERREFHARGLRSDQPDAWARRAHAKHDCGGGGDRMG
jgi:nucleoside-diphosphate-sugar epimerase